MKWFENPIKDFMAEHWDMFIEDSFGIRLPLWKKILLRAMSLNKDKSMKL